MHRRQKPVARLHEAIDQVADPDRRREFAEQAAALATRVASEVAKRSADLGSQVADTASDAAQAVAAERDHLLEQHAEKVRSKEEAVRTRKKSKPLKRRARRTLVSMGLGAVAAYFLDPKSGSDRRAAARRRTSTSAHVASKGFEKAATVAHRTSAATATAPATAPDPVTGAVPVEGGVEFGQVPLS
jgi:hypothetical protein